MGTSWSGDPLGIPRHYTNHDEREIPSDLNDESECEPCKVTEFKVKPTPLADKYDMNENLIQQISIMKNMIAGSIMSAAESLRLNPHFRIYPKEIQVQIIQDMVVDSVYILGDDDD